MCYEYKRAVSHIASFPNSVELLILPWMPAGFYFK